jgi:hypothetical protein
VNISLQHKETNMIKQTKVGFSWTTFFFGCLPSLFRGDWKWFFIQLGAALLTLGASSLVFMFIYNKLYINDLLEKGYAPSTDQDRTILKAKGFIA